jgi:predicted nucleic acid-binding protein
MRGDQNLTLFEKPKVYVLDTSAWSNIDKQADSESVWMLIEKLARQERLAICAPVLGELRRVQSLYAKRIKPIEDLFLRGDEKSPGYLVYVGVITRKYQGMCKPRRKRESADAYVIALAERNGYTVVSDETLKKRANRKMPGVCHKLDIVCKSLDAFITEVRAETQT